MGNIENKNVYDYIRILKPSAIRYIKKISLLIAAGFIITTVIVMSHSVKKETIVTPVNSTGSHDKKIQIDEAKKNSILRRFISYYEVKRINY